MRLKTSTQTQVGEKGRSRAILPIGVAFITHITHVRNVRKKYTFICDKERISTNIYFASLHLRVYNRAALKGNKLFASKIGTTLKGKNLLPGANSIPSFKSSPFRSKFFPFRVVPVLEAIQGRIFSRFFFLFVCKNNFFLTTSLLPYEHIGLDQLLIYSRILVSVVFDIFAY